MEEKLYVCGYNHCQIHDKVPASESVVVGNRRYHKQCSEIRDKINEMKELYIDEIDKNVKIVELMSVLNQIIFTKKIDIDYMLFAIYHIVRRKIRIKSPYSLHYIAKNKQILSMWEKDKNKRGGDKNC